MKPTLATTIACISCAILLAVLTAKSLFPPRKIRLEHNVLDLRKIKDNPYDIVRALDSASSDGYRVKAASGPIVILEKER